VHRMDADASPSPSPCPHAPQVHVVIWLDGDAIGAAIIQDHARGVTRYAGSASVPPSHIATSLRIALGKEGGRLTIGQHTVAGNHSNNDGDVSFPRAHTSRRLSRRFSRGRRHQRGRNNV
jgi:hypothetical protein